jgi:two-component system sensor kinase FixL
MLVVAAISFELVSQIASSSRLTQQVAANELRWESLLESIGLLVISSDTTGKINYVNPHLCQVSGYSADSLIGESYRKLLKESDFDRVDETIQSAFDGKLNPEEEIVLLTRSGNERTISWHSVVLRNIHNKASGIISVGPDITDRIQTEESLRDSLVKLEQVKRLNMLGELTSTLAHELNQPLTAILSNSQAARRFLKAENPDLAEVAEILDDVIQNNRHASEIIRRLRELIRPGEVELETVDLHQLIQDTIEICQSEFRERSIEWKLDLKAEKPIVEAGRVELQQVLLNLFANAMQAMTGSKQKQITISTKRENNTISIHVRDSGSGIAADLLPTIFDPLATTRPEGLGMGLAICRRMLEIHGGRIQARNHPDGGAEFALNFPSSLPTEK